MIETKSGRDRIPRINVVRLTQNVREVKSDFVCMLYKCYEVFKNEYNRDDSEYDIHDSRQG